MAKKAPSWPDRNASAADIRRRTMERPGFKSAITWLKATAEKPLSIRIPVTRNVFASRSSARSTYGGVSWPGAGWKSAAKYDPVVYGARSIWRPSSSYRYRFTPYGPSTPLVETSSPGTRVWTVFRPRARSPCEPAAVMKNVNVESQSSAVHEYSAVRGTNDYLANKGRS